MAVERSVIDEEYFREFLTFYATTHAEHPSTATRLHFFAASESTVRRAIDPGRPELTRFAETSYLGYCVLRPTSPMTVGETLLHAPETLAGNDCHVHCATVFGQTVQGKRFRVPAAPFIGQDQTGMCAQAAIWGACKYLHKYRYYPKVSMPEITLLARAGEPEMRFTRPADGLSRPAIYSVFSALGFQVNLTATQSQDTLVDSPREAIYTAIESGLPALLLLRSPNAGGGHAVWAVGHSDSKRNNLRGQEPEYVGGQGVRRLAYWSASAFAGHFLVHDDGIGPYLLAQVKWPAPSDNSDRHESNEMQELTELECRLIEVEKAVGITPHGYVLEYSSYIGKSFTHTQDGPPVVTDVIVPLPNEVFLKPADARRIAVTLLRDKHLIALKRYAVAGLVALTDDTVAFISEMTSSSLPEYVLRTFLCLSARYVEHVVKSSMAHELKRHYATAIRFPEYIWVTEILCVSQRKVVGEVILDSTNSCSALAARQDLPIPHLALHIPGALWLAIPEDHVGGAGPAPDRGSSAGTEYDLYLVPEDREYEPFARNSEVTDAPRSHRNLGPVRGAG